VDTWLRGEDVVGVYRVTTVMKILDVVTWPRLVALGGPFSKFLAPCFSKGLSKPVPPLAFDFFLLRRQLGVVAAAVVDAVAAPCLDG
jgi:hypothetical protein